MKNTEHNTTHKRRSVEGGSKAVWAGPSGPEEQHGSEFPWSPIATHESQAGHCRSFQLAQSKTIPREACPPQVKEMGIAWPNIRKPCGCSPPYSSQHLRKTKHTPHPCGLSPEVEVDLHLQSPAQAKAGNILTPAPIVARCVRDWAERWSSLHCRKEVGNAPIFPPGWWDPLGTWAYTFTYEGDWRSRCQLELIHALFSPHPWIQPNSVKRSAFTPT